MKPWVGLSLMHEQGFLQATLPLFLAHEVEVIEWSFDTVVSETKKPQWLLTLLKEYATNGRLLGHGVHYSLLNGRWTERQETCLNILQTELARYSYQHISEHFGFMSNTHFHKGALLPVSVNKTTLCVGHDRIKRLQQAAGDVRVGIENLAFAFSKEDVKKHGDFLNELIVPIDGFILLDLHNLYCQAKNFNVNPIDLLKSYPLEKVREIHISGGSWQHSVYSQSIKTVRRDTHDSKVPAALFGILAEALKLCPNLRYVILERLGDSFAQNKDQVEFRKDFLKIKSIVNNSEATFNSTVPHHKKMVSLGTIPINEDDLYSEQRFVSQTLLNSQTPQAALESLKNKQLQYWNIDEWNLSMLETAIYIAKKWE